MITKTGVLNILCLIIPMNLGLTNTVSADNFIIDDSGNNMQSALGTEWKFVADTVMGGESSGALMLDQYKGKDCKHLQGDVSTANNGGFVQMALSLGEQGVFDASAYAGIELEVAGNNENYNLHIRTAGLWFPWQSYRATFIATSDWKILRIPFTAFKPYKTKQAFRVDRLRRIGLLGIGRDFRASLCLASIRFYSE